MTRRAAKKPDQPVEKSKAPAFAAFSDAGASEPSVPPNRTNHAKWRAFSLSMVYVVFAIHIIHWKITGKTMAPLELNEVMYTLERGIITAGFIFMCMLVVGSFVFGRFFCSWACHIMVLQDLCAWILKKLRIAQKPIRSRLLLLVPPFTAAYMFVWPQVARSWQNRAFPDFHLATDSDGWASFATTDFWRNLPGPLIIVLTFLVCGFAIVYLLGTRSFCTYICPYGSIFGLADRFSPARIKVDPEACVQCGTCSRVCTSGVRVHEEVKQHGMIVNPYCLKDLDCLDHCPKGALHYTFTKPPGFQGKQTPYFGTIGTMGVTLVLFAALFGLWNVSGEFAPMAAMGLGAIVSALAVLFSAGLLQILPASRAGAAAAAAAGGGSSHSRMLKVREWLIFGVVFALMLLTFRSSVSGVSSSVAAGWAVLYAIIALALLHVIPGFDFKYAKGGRFGSVPYDFSIGEELLIAFVFLGSVLSFRGIYAQIPFLLSLGIGAVLAVTSVTAVRLLNRPEVSLSFVWLKRAGRLTRLGVGFVVYVSALALLTAHSAFVRYHEFAGLWTATAMLDAQATGDSARAERLAPQAVGYLSTAESWGLVENPNVERGLVSAYATLGQHKLAVDYAKRVLKRVPSDLTAWLTLGRSAAAIGDREEAIRAFRTLTTGRLEDPDAAEAGYVPREVLVAHEALSELLVQQGKFDEALAELKVAVRRGSDRASAYAHLGTVQAELARQQGKPAQLEAAITNMQHALELDPDYPDAHYNLGMMLSVMGRNADAIPQFQAALRESTDNHDARFNLSVAYMQTGRLEAAAEGFRQVLAARNDHADAHFDLGQILMRQGDQPSAERHFRAAAALSPRYAQFFEEQRRRAEQ